MFKIGFSPFLHPFALKMTFSINFHSLYFPLFHTAACWDKNVPPLYLASCFQGFPTNIDTSKTQSETPKIGALILSNL